MKKTLTLLLSVILLATLSLSVSAKGSLLDDSANLLDYSQEIQILSKLEAISSSYGVDVSIHTTMSTYGAEIYDYAEEYYLTNEFAEDGLVFIINLNNNEVGNRDFYTYYQGLIYDTFGFDAYDSEIGYINDQILPYLIEEDYYSAFDEYITLTEKFLTGEIEYTPYEDYVNDGYVDDYYNYDYDEDFYYEDYEDVEISPVVGEIIVIGVGLLVAFIVTLIMKSMMNTAVAKKEAADYMKKGSLKLTKSLDIYTHRTVAKTPIPKNTNSSSGRSSSGGHSGGGGGVRSGGGGGKF